VLITDLIPPTAPTLTVSSIHLLPGWGLPANMETGENIGGVAPADYGVDLDPAGAPPGSIMLWAAGSTPPGQFSGVLFKPPFALPILPGAQNFSGELDFIPVEGFDESTETFEYDWKISQADANGKLWLFNFSHDNSQAAGGQERVTDASGNHVEIGLATGMFVVGQPYKSILTGTFSAAKQVSSFETVTLNAQTQAVPLSLQNQPAAPGWPAGAYGQVQLNRKNIDGMTAVIITGLTLTTW
jgi:hypothetical protein